MHLITTEQLTRLSISFILILAGYLFALKFSQLLEKAVVKRFSRHIGLLVKRTSFYCIFILFLLMGLQNLGINLSVFLGAAGILTVALSFASQTAFSNLISGIFLLFEQPFKIGDTISVNNIQGVVESIDLLSTKLTTTDHQRVRLPNETLIKSEIFNLSFYPIRRIDLVFSFTLQQDVTDIKALLLEAARSCPDILDKPKASAVFNQFVDGCAEIKLMAWAKNARLAESKDCLQEYIKKRFLEEGIELATPQIVYRTRMPTEG